MNVWDYVIIGVLAAAVVFVIMKIVKNKKQGKTSCGCDCSRCGGCTCSKEERK